MYPSRFRYVAPSSLDEAIALLRDGDGEAKVLAGGQSLIPLMKLRFASPEVLVDINNLPGLDHHTVDADGTLRIGALCRHAHLERSPLIAAPAADDGRGGSAHRRPDRALARHPRRLAVPRRPAGRLGRRRHRAGWLRRRPGVGRRPDHPGRRLRQRSVPERAGQRRDRRGGGDPTGRRGPRVGGYLKLERRVGDFATAGAAVARRALRRPRRARGHRPHRRRARRRSTPPTPRRR